MQRAHRQAIPFENLDILRRLPIALDTESLLKKLVANRRGGYCFEQNRLLADMLAELGVSTRPLLARVRLGQAGGAHPPRSHVLLLVEGGWLADAG
ncbi:MAG TPA: arylamine N-acetyltransferase, partial [Croceibacterium sp.]